MGAMEAGGECRDIPIEEVTSLADLVWGTHGFIMIYYDLMGFMFFFFRAWFGMGFGMGFEIKAVAFIGRFWVFWPIWFEQCPPIFGFFSSRLPSGEHTKNYG